MKKILGFVPICLFLVSLTFFSPQALANTSPGLPNSSSPVLPAEDFSLTTPIPTVGYTVVKQEPQEQSSRKDVYPSSDILGQQTVKSPFALNDYFSVLSRVSFFVVLIILAAILVEVLVVSGKLRKKPQILNTSVTAVRSTPLANSVPGHLGQSVSGPNATQGYSSPNILNSTLSSPPTPLVQTVSGQAKSNVLPTTSVSTPLASLPPLPKKKIDKKTIITGLIIAFLLIAVPLTLVVVKQRQEIRKKAGTGSECFDPPRVYRPAPYPYQLNATSSPDDDDWVLYPIKDTCANVERLTQLFGPLDQIPSLPNVYIIRPSQPYQYGFTFNRIMHIDGYDDQQILQGFPELDEATLDTLHQQNKDTQSIQDCDKNGRQVVFDLSGSDPNGKVAKPNGWTAWESGYYQFDLTPKFQCEGSALHQGSLGAGFIRVTGQVPTSTPTPTIPVTTGTPIPTTTPAITSTPTPTGRPTPTPTIPLNTPTPTITGAPTATATPTPTNVPGCGQRQCTTNADCPADFPYCFDRPSDNIAIKVCVINTSWYDGCETWSCAEKRCIVGSVPNGCPSAYPVCASIAGKGEVCVINASWSDGCNGPLAQVTPTIAVPPIPNAAFELPAVLSVVGGIILLVLGILL